MDIDLKQLQHIVRDVVQSTLLPHYLNVTRQYKKDGSIVTKADTEMQSALTLALAKVCPDTTLLGEEMPMEHQQMLLESGRSLWCLDPIDGTSNFATGMPYFSVSLALIENNAVKMGLVYDPIRDESFTAIAGQGAWLNDEPLKAETSGLSLKQSIALIDFKRLPKNMAKQLVEELPFGSQRNLGSIALELCWIAAGRAHLYLHGSQHLWDYAAAQLIINEAGAFIDSLDKTDLTACSLQKRSACAAVDKNLFEAWHHYLQSISL